MAVRSTTFAIVLAFFAVVAAFVAAGFLEESKLADIDTSSQKLARSTLPSIERLITIRSNVRALDTQLDDFVEATPEARPVTVARIDRLVRALEAESDSIDAAIADDRAASATLRRDADALGAVVDRLVARARLQNADDLRALRDREVHPAIAAVEGDARALLEARAARAESIATAIGEARAHTHRVTLALDAACIALAIAATVLTARGIRRYTRLLEQHGRVVEARANELEQFAARVAHDVLSPLTAVSFGVAYARRLVTEPAALKSLDRAVSSLDRVRALVDALYAFARSGAHPTPGARADVTTVIEGIAEELRREAEASRVELVVERSAPCAVACAGGVLASIVQNLARNAVKYIDGGAERIVTLRALASATTVRIEVADTGPGIPEGSEERIFEPYVRASRSASGLGLGLATVKRLAVAHGGAIGVRSMPGKGSTFWVELPRAS